MKVILSILMIISVSAASAADLRTDQEADFWLTKMTDAIQTQNYDISLVVLEPANGIKPYRWRHALTEQGNVEHLSLLNGPGRDIVRVDDVVSYFEPNIQPYSLKGRYISGPLPGNLLHEPQSLKQSYEFVLVGKSRVAGYATQQLRIVSKDKSRFSFNLWIEQESGLPLKLDMLDHQGKVIEQVQITSLRVTEQPEQSLQRIQVDELPPVVQIKTTSGPSHNWFAGWLPDGMEEVKRDVHRVPVTGDIVDYLLYSDGLVDVSVYIQKAKEDTTTPLLYRFGSETYFSARQGNLDIVVLGRVPAETASRIAQYIVAKYPAP